MFQKTRYQENQKNYLRFKVVDLWAWEAPPYRGQGIDDSLSQPRAELQLRPPKVSNKQFTKSCIFKIPDLVHRSTPAAVAGGNCR